MRESTKRSTKQTRLLDIVQSNSEMSHNIFMLPPTHTHMYILSARKHIYTNTLTNTALTTTAHCRQRSHQSRDHIEENSCSCNCKQLPCLLSDRIAAEVNCVENYNIYKSQIVIILSFLINA